MRQSQKQRTEVFLDSLTTHLEEADGVDAGECGIESGRSVVASDDRIIPVSENAALTNDARFASTLKIK